MKNKLELRAKKSLLNPSEVDDDSLDSALNDAIEECKNKSVKEWAKMDFAYIRLKIYLKIALNEEDELLLKMAKKEIDISPVVLESGEIKTRAEVMQRENIWE